MERSISWLQIALGVLLGVFGLLSSSSILQLLGGLAILISLVLAWGEWRRRQRGSERMDFGMPDLSILERWLPWIFFTTALLIVLILTIFTLFRIGLL